MGITIHFSGRLRSAEDYLRVTGAGRALAQRKGVIVYELDVERKELIRVKNGEVKTYESSVRGIAFGLHPEAEHIRLQFDRDNYLQEFCKTQFAGVATHLEVLDFLREIEPYFENFNVIDEGGFWETGDLGALEDQFERMNQMLGMLGDALSDSSTPPGSE